MKLSDFDYDLPEGRIAQVPVEPRDAARLFVHDGAATEHRLVRDLPDLLRPGDLVVVNDTRVRPARLCGRRATGGAVELLVIGPAALAQGPAREALAVAGVAAATPLWRAFVNPARRVAPGERVELEGGALEARFVERGRGPDGRPGSEWTVALSATSAPEAGADEDGLDELLERFGRMPLPPYIRRGRGDDPLRDSDRERYQTVFAERPGAIAAPTAGLHFTPQLLAALDARGVERASVTLHVGLGTFLPVTSDDVEGHEMHAERCEVSDATARAVRATHARGARVVAVGTTVTRALESAAVDGEAIGAWSGETRLFIRPGFRFRAVDALLTNFHLPRSTLLMLVCAFAGRETVLAIYREAIEAGYRFYSYGDAMLITRRGPRA